MDRRWGSWPGMPTCWIALIPTPKMASHRCPARAAEQSEPGENEQATPEEVIQPQAVTSTMARPSVVATTYSSSRIATNPWQVSIAPTIKMHEAGEDDPPGPCALRRHALLPSIGCAGARRRRAKPSEALDAAVLVATARSCLRSSSYRELFSTGAVTTRIEDHVHEEEEGRRGAEIAVERGRLFELRHEELADDLMECLEADRDDERSRHKRPPGRVPVRQVERGEEPHRRRAVRR